MNCVKKYIFDKHGGTPYIMIIDLHHKHILYSIYGTDIKCRSYFIGSVS